MSRDPIKTQNREAEAAAKMDEWDTLVTEFSKEAQFGEILSEMEDFCLFILLNNNIPESPSRSSVMRQ